MFNVKEVTEGVINWIREWFEKNGKGCNAIVGISGGKDSTVVAALCVAALGKDRVVGVMMPNGYQNDIDDAKRVCEILGIQHYLVDIGDSLATLYNRLLSVAADAENPLPPVVTTNTPARIRMATLYAIAGLVGGRVCNTGNASEFFIGYTTKYGDLAGDFALFKNLTVRDVYAIGDYLELPMNLVHKHPADGMSGKTDEDNTGIPYDAIDDYLIDDIYPEQSIYEKMIAAHQRNLHKRVINLDAPRRVNCSLNIHCDDFWAF